jgi:hypothetical protein
MLDFGNAGAYSGTNSPAHAAGAIPTTYTTWHQVNDTTKNAGFHIAPPNDYNGVATDSGGFNVEYDLGRARKEGDGSVNYGESLVGNWAYRNATPAGSGIWDTDLTRDAGVDFVNESRDPLGIRLALNPGDYDVYVTAHYRGNTNVPLDLWIGGLSNSGETVSMAATGMTQVADEFYPDAVADETIWTEGSDYIKYNITLAAGEFLYVLSNNTNNIGSALANDATLSSMQIVTIIPEPGTLLLLVITGAALLLFRRRQR